MVRREIKAFDIVSEGIFYPCSLPFSIHTVLSEAGFDLSGLVGKALSLQAKIYVDEAAFAMRNFYLRISGLRMPCTVYIGDKLVGECDGSTPVCNLNLKGIIEQGESILSIRFNINSESDILRAGLTKAPELIRFSGAIIDKIALVQKHTEAGISLGISLDLIGNSEKVRAVATLVSPTGQLHYAGLTKGKGSVSISDPLFWWPNGLGVQNLYRLTVNLYDDSAEIEDTAEMRVGIRKIKTEGASVYVGGLKVIPMGAIYIADDSPDIAAAERRAETYVTSAASCGFNTLVVPLASPTPSERFYELCDQYGIMVIEEHKALDDGEIESLRRRSCHASLAMIEIIGNEEGEELKEAIFKLIPDLDVSLRDNTEHYVSAPALPSLKTIRTVIPEGERSLFSRSIEAIAEEGAIADMLLSVAERYPYPGDLSAFAYASALAAANKVGRTVKESRMSQGKSGRAVYSRLGDNSLAISPSSIDHKNRWKPLQYYSKRHFSPVKIYAEYEDGYVMFSASVHRKSDVIGTLEYRIADSSNNTIYKISEHAEIPGMTAARLASTSISEHIAGHENEYYLEYLLKEGSSILSRGVLLFVPEKHFEFKKPKIKAVVTGEGKRFSLTISADCFVKDLEVDFDGVDILLSDNYLDLTSEAPIKLDFTVLGAPQTTYHLKDAMMLRSVYDLK